jgi:hypothetical protein
MEGGDKFKEYVSYLFFVFVKECMRLFTIPALALMAFSSLDSQCQ